MSRRPLTTAQYIRKAMMKHGVKYDYSKVNYLGSTKKIMVGCPIHGWFEQSANNHITGSGCPACGTTKGAKSRKLTTAAFIEKAIKKHGDLYNYSETHYTGGGTCVTILCPIHGPFHQLPNIHLNGSGCIECGKVRSNTMRRLSREGFIRQSMIKHGIRYDYSQMMFVDRNTPVKIGCPVHGYIETTPQKHVNTVGCPICSKEQRRERKRMSTAEYVARAKEVNKDRYQYGCTQYKGMNNNILVYCPYRGVIEVNAREHLKKRSVTHDHRPILLLPYKQ